MVDDAAHTDKRPLGLRARLATRVEAIRRFCDDVCDSLVCWWRTRFPGGPNVPWEDVKRRYGL